MRATILLFFLTTTLAFAQKEDHIWMLGYEGEPDSVFSTIMLDFNESPPFITKIFQDFSLHVANTSISNSEGELVCYSNGVEIRNDNYEVISNGDEFQPSSSYSGGYPIIQASLLLPMPNSESQYLYLLGDLILFELDGWLTGGTSPLTYSIVDFDTNTEGVVLEKKIAINADTLSGGLITATRHANGRDWWVLMNKHTTNQYYSFMLSPEGIATNGIQFIGDTVRDGLSQAAFSPNGAWYAQFSWTGIIGSGNPTHIYIDLYQFDRCTGLLSNHLQIKDEGAGAPGGVSFSPNSRFMYISASDKIYQFDLENSDIVGSRDTVAVYDGFEGEYENVTYQTLFFLMQNTPDNKIYISCPNTSSQYLHVIDQPDSLGMACNVLQHHVELPSFNNFGLPNFPNFRLGALSGSSCDTLRPIAAFNYIDNALEVTFEDLTTKNPTSWHWDFGDSMSSNVQHPIHSYAASGQYEICLIASNSIGSDTVCQEISLITDNTYSINSEQSLSIQPNPAIDYLFLNFKIPLKKVSYFSIHSVTGEELLLVQLKEGMIENMIDISHLPSGLYFYKVKYKEIKGAFSGKVIISE